MFRDRKGIIEVGQMCLKVDYMSFTSDIITHLYSMIQNPSQIHKKTHKIDIFYPKFQSSHSKGVVLSQPSIQTLQITF